jgi:hypothetical protein
MAYVKVTECKEPLDWYSNHIGELFVVEDYVYISGIKLGEIDIYYINTLIDVEFVSKDVKVKLNNETFIKYNDIEVLTKSEVRKLKFKQLRNEIKI